VDIYIVSHHGSITSNSALFLNGIAPRVAIMDNGETKGGAPSSWDAVKKSLTSKISGSFIKEGGAITTRRSPSSQILQEPTRATI